MDGEVKSKEDQKSKITKDFSIKWVRVSGVRVRNGEKYFIARIISDVKGLNNSLFEFPFNMFVENKQSEQTIERSELNKYNKL